MSYGCEKLPTIIYRALLESVPGKQHQALACTPHCKVLAAGGTNYFTNDGPDEEWLASIHYYPGQYGDVGKTVTPLPKCLSNQGPDTCSNCTNNVSLGEHSLPLSGSQFFFKVLAAHPIKNDYIERIWTNDFSWGSSSLTFTMV